MLMRGADMMLKFPSFCTIFEPHTRRYWKIVRTFLLADFYLSYLEDRYFSLPVFRVHTQVPWVRIISKIYEYERR